MSDLTLRANGLEFGGWKSVVLRMQIESMAASFNVSYAEKWLAESKPRQIKEQDAVQVAIDGDTVLDGYVDTSEIAYDARSHSATVAGRSKTGDLIDCSAIHKTGQWKGQTLTQIAKDLCDPFGIKVVVEANTGPKIKEFSIQEGESAFEALSRLAQTHGLLLVSNTGGDCVFTRAGKTKVRTRLELGKNIKRGGRRGSMQDRYSEYIIKAQTPGTDDWFGKKAATPTRTAKDDSVLRYRPLILIAEDSMSGKDMEKRANWERNTRAGKSQRLPYQVRGWHHDDGLWMPNTMVPVKDSFLGIDEELLIAGVTLTLSDQGEMTDIEVTRREAFDAKELPPPSKKSAWSL